MDRIGQINRGSILGEKIYELSRLLEVKTIVEIGTWNGMGSTKCIYDAVIGTKKEVWSLECNLIRIGEAKVNLVFLPSSFKIIHGTIVTYQELAPKMNILENDTLKNWLKEDLGWIKTSPYVLDQLPEKIDLYIIDGGEFSGYIEFNKLWKKCKFIVLDDTISNKHTQTRKFILENPDKFKILDDNLKDRNGFLICEVCTIL
jgi:hypothetical protein